MDRGLTFHIMFAGASGFGGTQLQFLLDFHPVAKIWKSQVLMALGNFYQISKLNKQKHMKERTNRFFHMFLSLTSK